MVITLLDIGSFTFHPNTKLVLGLSPKYGLTLCVVNPGNIMSLFGLGKILIMFCG
jgi:hypothetical protein